MLTPRVAFLVLMLLVLLSVFLGLLLAQWMHHGNLPADFGQYLGSELPNALAAVQRLFRAEHPTKSLYNNGFDALQSATHRDDHAGPPHSWYGLCPRDTPLVALQAYIEAIPALATWYAGFAWTHARIVGAPHGMLQHVAYRHTDGRIAWTRHPLALHAGEPLVTDGVRTIRAWCCNELVSVPPAPPAHDEPPTEALQPPALLSPGLPPLLTMPPTLAPPWMMRPPFPIPPHEVPLVFASGPPPGGTFLPPIITTGGSTPVPVLPPVRPPPQPVPEPGTWVLVLGGLSVVVLTWRRAYARTCRRHC